MAKIELPHKSKNVDDEEKKDDVVTAMQQQVTDLTSQIAELNKGKDDAGVKAKAKDDEEKRLQLEAEADIKALLSEGGDVADTGQRKTQGVDDMSNAQLIDVIATAVDTAIAARIKQSSQDVDEKLKTTNSAVENVAKAVGQVLASIGIERVRGKHKDFDTYKEDTYEVLKKYPMMDIEDALMLAKQLRKGDSPSASETDMERSTNTPFGDFSGRRTATEATKAKKSSETPQSGVIGFRNLVQAALDKRFG